MNNFRVNIFAIGTIVVVMVFIIILATTTPFTTPEEPTVSPAPTEIPTFVRGANQYIPEKLFYSSDPEQSTFVWTEEEYSFFSNFLFAVAGGSDVHRSSEEYYSIGAVFLNRVESVHFPDTLDEVLRDYDLELYETVAQLKSDFSDKNLFLCRGIVDDLVVHNYRPLRKDVLAFVERGAEINEWSAYPLGHYTPSFLFYSLESY